MDTFLPRKITIIGCLVWGLLLLGLAIPGALQALEDYKKYYLEGLEYKEKGLYEHALAAFDRAVALNSTEKRKMRFYGMRYGEYMPHREKGICHYLLKQYPQAVAELETSLQQRPSETAIKYLNLARIELAKLRPEDRATPLQAPPELKALKPARTANRDAVAVVIGNRDYRNRDIPAVDFAVRDAEMIRQALLTTFGYREGNIIFRTNATKGVLENIFGSVSDHKGLLNNAVRPGKSDVFVYYSGHGAPSLESRKGYILPVDGNPNTVSISGYALDLLYGNLAKIPARTVTIVTDACFSGATLFKKASPVGIVVRNPLAALKNTTIMNSSEGTQLSSWYPEKGHGLFTYFFLLGLTGEADTNGDRRITVDELSAYIDDNVPYMARKLHSGRRQTPSFNISDGRRTVVDYQ
jgi:tetratricopeptide (TPR) repeat protein